MTRSFSPNGVPGLEVAAYYRCWVQDQVGLMLLEGTVIARPASSNQLKVLDFYGEPVLAGWQHAVDEVHALLLSFAF